MRLLIFFSVAGIALMLLLCVLAAVLFFNRRRSDKANLLREPLRDVSDTSKIEEEKMELHPGNYDFRSFIDNISTLFRFIADKKGLEFRYREEGEMPYCLYGDDTGLRQVLTNICGNAVKFTDKGYIEFIVKTDDSSIIFEIKDTGIGISNDDIRKLFDPVTEDAALKNRELQGAGSGLPAGRAFVEMMGGEIRVESQYGLGTSFFVSVPKILGDAKRIKSQDYSINQEGNSGNGVNPGEVFLTRKGHLSKSGVPAEKDRLQKEILAQLEAIPDTDKKIILAVDDSPANLTIIRGVLEESYKVYLVDSGATALRFLEMRTPDLILLDVDMPSMSGIDLINLIKPDKNLADIPIIFLTAMEDVQTETLAFKLGAVDYIRKPIVSELLTARVKLHLELRFFRLRLQEMVAEKTSQILRLQRIVVDLLAVAGEYKDAHAGNHIRRTTAYVRVVLDNLPKSYQIPKEYYDDIIMATPLHDIGKTSIPDEVLLKPGRLNDKEFEIIKSHVTSGIILIQKAIDEYNEPSFLDVALEIVKTHHERWDGKGYPNSLEGEEIPVSGRIMAIADVYDALRSERPYKEPLGHDTAIEIIAQNKGEHFDPVITDVFLSIRDSILEISREYESDSIMLNH